MATTTNVAATGAWDAARVTLTTVVKAALTSNGSSDLAVSVGTGGLLTPDMVASLRLKSLWTYYECQTIANFLAKTITFTLV